MHSQTKHSAETIPSVFGILHSNPAPGQVRVAVFDFDGTVSLLRAGWQQVMIDLFVERVPRLDGEREQDIRHTAQEFVHRTNGQPTLLQMQEIADTVRARGNHALTADEYKAEFLKRLRLQTDPRLAAVQSSPLNAEQWQMPGIRTLLEMLRARGVLCYIASGTDEQPVRNETALLGLNEYFAGIYGARDDFANSTKTAIIRGLVGEHHLQENEFVVFGDGIEEIRVGKQMGALAVGIARSDQTGALDEEQKARLANVGADVYVTDFRVAESIMHYLFGHA